MGIPQRDEPRVPQVIGRPLDELELAALCGDEAHVGPVARIAVERDQRALGRPARKTCR